MRKVSVLSITLSLVATQLLTINLISPANAAEPRTPVTLTLIHNNDGESSLGADAIYKSSAGDLRAGSTAAFATVFDREIADARQLGNAVLSVYAGDSFLPSKNMICSEPGDPKSQKPVLDAVAQAQMPYDVHILGNHEFDYGTGFLSRYIKAFGANGKRKHPFISGNLDFSKNSDLKSMVGRNTLSSGSIANGKVLGRSYIHTDPVTKHRFGVVSAVTWSLRTISSPGSVKLTTNDLQSTAKAVQAQVDTLQRMGINKIILVSHLQAASNDKELVALLRGVDIAVAGGGDELLQNPAIDNAMELIPGESTPVGEYPTMLSDKGGNEVPLVTTSGNYKYLGRADLFFDEKGNLDVVNPLTSYPRRVVPVSTVATAAGVTDAVTPKASIVTSVDTPLNACLAGFTNAIAASNTVFVLPVTGKVGEITRGNTFDLLPFGNTLVAVTNVSPKELKEIFERSCSISTAGGGQFLQISGMKVVCLRNGTAQVVSTPASGATTGTITTEGTRVKSITLSDGRAIVSGGAVVAGAPSVTIVTNNFTADGGDNYPALAALKKSAFGIDYEVALYEYLRTFPAGTNGLPTIPDTDVRYKALTGEGRFTWE